MQVNAKFLILVIFLLIIGCKTNNKESKIEDIHSTIVNAITEGNGKILYDKSVNNRLDTIVYVTPKGLFWVDPNKKKVEKLYNSFDSLKVQQFNISSADPFRIQRDEKWTEHLDEKMSNYSQLNLYRVVWPWVFIGQDFVANIRKPKVLIDLNGLYDTRQRLRNLPLIRGGKTDGSKGNYQIDNNANLEIKLTNSQEALPGFTSYKTTEIPQGTWSGTHIYTDLLYEYYDVFNGTSYSPENYCAYTYEEGKMYELPVMISKNNVVTIDGKVIWNGNVLNSDSLSYIKMEPLYKERESLISKDMEGYKDNCIRRINELIPIIEKERLEEQKQQIQDIKNQAVSLDDIIKAYCSNEIKAKRDYPFNQRMLIKASLKEIQRTNGNFRYLMTPEWLNIDQEVFIYTNDNQFTDFSYPKYVYMSVLFEGVSAETSWFTELTTYKFVFSNAQALIWKDD